MLMLTADHKITFIRDLRNLCGPEADTPKGKKYFGLRETKVATELAQENGIHGLCYVAGFYETQVHTLTTKKYGATISSYHMSPFHYVRLPHGVMWVDRLGQVFLGSWEEMLPE